MKFFHLPAAVLLCLAGLYSSAQSVKPVKVTSVEGITEYRLNNGLKVLLFPDPSKPSITVNITYLVGSRMEGYGETGMAHLLEHMVFKGSTNHTNIPNELTSHGASPNGTTSYDRTNYYETFNASDDNLKWALSLEADRMVNSFIAKKDLETEFSVVRNEFEAGENNPSGVLMQRVSSAAYLWHNYGKSTIGSKEDIERVPIDNLKAFYQRFYQPDNAVLTIAGKIDEAKVLELVNQYFGSIARPSRMLSQTYTVEPVQEGERHVDLRRSGDVQELSCAYHVPAGSDPDFAAVKVMVDIFSDEPSGRIYKALVETKKASGEFAFVRALKDPGLAYFSVEVLKEKSLADAHNALMSLFDNIQSAPFTAAEVDRSKIKMLKNIEQLWNSSDRVGLNLSEYIAQGDWRTFFIYRDRLEKVTADDVNRVAKAYLKKSNRTVGEFIPDAKPERAVIPATPDVQALVKDYKGKAALAAGEQFDASPANIEKRTKKGTIEGGAQYALLSKTTRGNAVTMNLTLRVGADASMKDKQTIADLTADMLDKGTKTKSREQIKDAFDKLKVNINIGGSGQSVFITLTTTHDNLVPSLKLLTEVLRQPAFPAAEFDKLKDENLTQLEQQRSEPQALAGNALERYLHPYAAGNVHKTLSFDEMITATKAAKLDDVKKFYTDFYNGANATLAIVGDFDEASVIGELKSMLGSWQSAQKYEYVPEQIFDVAVKSDKIKTPDKKNAMMMAQQLFKMYETDPDYPSLSMGNFMLGGGFLSSRLAVRIRQKEGISYGVGSYVSAGNLDNVARFGSYAIYNPTNADKLMAAYKEELEKMIKDGFTSEEMKDAKAGYLQQRELGRSRDAQLAQKLSYYLNLKRTMDFDDKMDKAISALTVEQVNTAMKKYIDPAKISFVQAGDFQ